MNFAGLKHNISESFKKTNSLKIAIYPQFFSVTFCLIFSLLVWFSEKIPFTEFITVFCSLWFYLYQIPLKIADFELSALPLLPTFLLILLIFFQVKKILEQRLVINIKEVILSVVVPPVFLGIVFLALENFLDSNTSQIELPNILQIFFFVPLVSVIGVGVALFLNKKDDLIYEIELKFNIPGLVNIIWKTIIFWGKATIIAFGILIILMGSDVLTQYKNYSGFYSKIMITLVCFAYIPNLLIWLIGLSTGAALQIGDGHISVFVSEQVSLPDLPFVSVLIFFQNEGYQKLFFLIIFALTSIYFGKEIFINSKIKSERNRLNIIGAGFLAIIATIVQFINSGNVAKLGKFTIVFPEVFIFTFAYLLLFSSFYAIFKTKIVKKKKS